MGADVTFIPGQGNKTPFFKALDSIGNNASARQLQAIREKLEAGVPLLDIYEGIERRQSTQETKDKRHVGTHWLGTSALGASAATENPAWWPDETPEDKLRKGIIKVITLQLETSPPRKVDYWWISDAEGFRVVPCVKQTRVIVVVLTPTPPTISVPVPRR